MEKLSKKEVLNRLSKVFNEALDGATNNPVEIEIDDHRKFAGFHILENNGKYVIGITATQRQERITSPQAYNVTYISIDSIVMIKCPELSIWYQEAVPEN